MLGWRYQPLYTFLPVEQDYAYVVAADYVSTEDGTGHRAYGAGLMALKTWKRDESTTCRS